MSTNRDDYTEQFNFIYNAINDTQETIRFTDTKSGAIIVVIMGLIAGLVTLIDKYSLLLIQFDELSRIIAIIGLFCFLLCLFISLFLSLRSINPANNPSEHIDLGEWPNMPRIKYYLSGLTPSMRCEDYLWELKDSKFCISTSEYYKSIDESEEIDLLKSLTFELIKLSFIKEKKMQRTKVALRWLEQCIWITALTMMLIAMTNYIKPEVSLNIGSLDINTFVLLMIGHVVGDFLLQTSWQSENKYNIWKALIIHSVVYSVVVYLISLMAGGISLISISVIFLSHILLDRGKIVYWWIKTIKKEQSDKKQVQFMVDQSLHVLVLLIISIIN